MKKISLFLFLAIISCKKAPDKTAEKPNIQPDTTVQTIDSTHVVSTPSTAAVKDSVDILLPTRYRNWGEDNEVNALTKNWMELYVKDGKYFLQKANYTIKNGYDECAEISTKDIETKEKVVIFINDPLLKAGSVSSVPVPRVKIWPQENVSFQFEGITYFLRAEGKVLSTEKVYNENSQLEVYKNVENYKLYLSTHKNNEQLLMKVDSFNDTFVELLFVGDIDKDGKPDFIFSANRDYEEQRVLVYLSSGSKGTSLIQKSGEIAVQFDC